MLAERKEHEAGEQLSQYQKLYNQECQQYTELEDYNAHYLKAYSGGQEHLQVAQMIRYSELISRLSATLVEQQKKIDQMNENLQQLRLYWHMLHQKTQAMSDMIDDVAVGEALELENRLQKELDDLARNRPKW